MIGVFLEALARLPARLFFGLMLGGPTLGALLLVIAIILFARKSPLGIAFVVVGIGGLLTGALMLLALVTDVLCTSRTGAWIC